MATIKVRYLERKKLATGAVAHYYNPPPDAIEAGILIRCPLGENEAEAIGLANSYNRMLDEWRAGDQVKTHAHGSIDWLIREFEDSSWYLKNARKTQTEYSKCLKALANYELPKSKRRLGLVMAAALSPPVADEIYKHFQNRAATGEVRNGKPVFEPTTLSWANAIMRVARRCWNFGARRGVPTNPFTKMGLIGTESREVIWSPEQLDAFVKKADDMGWYSVGSIALLMREFCQREGDMLRLPPKHYDGSALRVKQSKTKKLVWAPASTDARTRLDRHVEMLQARREQQLQQQREAEVAQLPLDRTLIVCETTQAQWGEDYFRHVAAEIRDKAGLPADLWIADLRRTGLDELGDAGATEDELMAVGGHTTRQTVSVYVKPSTTKAENAMQKREAARARRRASSGESK